MNPSVIPPETIAQPPLDEWEARFGRCASEAELALEAELRRLPLGEVGARVRDEFLYEHVVFAGRPVEQVAGEFALSPRTVSNIVRAMMRQSAVRQARLDAMTLCQLYDEEERLELLAQGAMMAWRASSRPERRVRTAESRRLRSTTTSYRERLGQPRYLEIANRADVELMHLRPQLERRTREMLAESERLARVRVRTVPHRTRRRISMSGKTLRLPLFGRKASVARSAAVTMHAVVAHHHGKCVVGIPPPDS